MFDSYFDPPESPEPPECPEPGCPGYGDEQGVKGNSVVFSCAECGATWTLPVDHLADFDPADMDPPEDHIPEEIPEPGPDCPHGNPWGECGACDHAGDIAFDADRERRHFGR